MKAAAGGYHGQLRIALSDGIAQRRLTALPARCREDEPDVDIRLFETPFAHQVKGLRNDLYDAGFAQSAEVGDGLIALPIWSEPLLVAVPARYPLLAYKRLPLDEVLRYPLVISRCVCEGCSQQVAKVLRTVDMEPIVAEQVTTHDLMMTMVAAGYGLGFATEAQISGCRNADVVARPLAGRSPILTTYLLRPDIEPSEQLNRFIDRVSLVDPKPDSSIIQREVTP